MNLVGRGHWMTGWWRRGGSNSRPSHCERDALPAELRPPLKWKYCTDKTISRKTQSDSCIESQCKLLLHLAISRVVKYRSNHDIHRIVTLSVDQCLKVST